MCVFLIWARRRGGVLGYESVYNWEHWLLGGLNLESGGFDLMPVELGEKAKAFWDVFGFVWLAYW